MSLENKSLLQPNSIALDSVIWSCWDTKKSRNAVSAEQLHLWNSSLGKGNSHLWSVTEGSASLHFPQRHTSTVKVKSITSRDLEFYPWLSVKSRLKVVWCPPLGGRRGDNFIKSQFHSKPEILTECSQSLTTYFEALQCSKNQILTVLGRRGSVLPFSQHPRATLTLESLL